MPMTAKYWRERAERARSFADRVLDLDIRCMMLEMAEGCEQMARLLDRDPLTPANNAAA